MEQQQTIRQQVVAPFQGANFKTTIILLSSTILMITWKYFGSAEFYRESLAPSMLILGDVDYTAAVYMFMSSFLLLGVVPAAIVRFVFKESLADYGVRIGNGRSTLITLAFFIPIFILAAYLGTRDPAVREIYPINRSAALAFGPHAFLFLCFYVGWEFHFRGFLQHGLQPAFGLNGGIWVQIMASTLIHIGLPTSETYLAIVGGFLWGIVVYRTRSLLAGLLMHFSLGIFADYFLLYHGN